MSDFDEQTVMIMAEQQLTGFFHGRSGYNLRSLIEAMGLTKEEFQEMKDKGMVVFGKEKKQEVDKVLNQKRSDRYDL
jgi:hypothetical protein